VLDRSQHADDAFYAFMGWVRLRLVEHNVDAITATMFLRELVEAGGSTLRVEQAMAIAPNDVEGATPRHRGEGVCAWDRIEVP
jgi:hypothetical protein